MPTYEKSHHNQQSTAANTVENYHRSQRSRSPSNMFTEQKQPINSNTSQKSIDQHDNKSCSGQSSLSSNGSNSSDVESRQFSSNADYDHIKNTTLMFFLDRLYIASSKDGKEARTLHDLSCLFGTKDFTKEMRQIVGASRNGLKKFLQSYPSLFTIEGDKVYLTQLKQDSNQSVRDYNKEAVEYFTQKLLHFGSSKVPIKNLFGYRSQASQEVRHVSGKNTREFKQFLSAHEDAFQLILIDDDEYVMSKSAFEDLKSNDEFNEIQKTNQKPLSHDDIVVMDPYLNKQFAHLIEDIMKNMLPTDSSAKITAASSSIQSDDNMDRITVEDLHARIMKDCNNQLFLNMVKTIEDLKVFLRMHPKLFKRFKCDEDDRDYVCLLTEEEKRELEKQSFPSLITRQHSTLKRIATDESNISSLIEQPISLPKLPIDQETDLSSSINNHKQLSKNLSSLKEIKNLDKHPSTSPSSNNNNNGNSSLRATAPPFIPSAYNQQCQQQQQPASLQHNTNYGQNLMSKTGPNNQQQVIKPMQRSVSNLTSSNQRPGIIDPRNAVRSYLLKASAENNNINQHGPFKHPNVLKSSNNFNHQSSQLLRQSSNVSDDLKARTVNIVREASNIIARIMSTTDAVALDCKGYNLGFNGQITMIQFGFLPNTMISSTCISNDNNNKQQPKQKPEVCIFDLITNPELAYCLKPLLESESIVKIVHDVRNKSNLLYSQFEIMLNHVFDTQVANLVIQQQDTGRPAYKSRYISMNRLCEIYGDESLMKYRNIIKTRHSGNQNNLNSTTSGNKTKDVNYWRTRPLTDAMVFESTMDVYCLVGGVYQNLKSKLKEEYMPLFEQLNLEGVLARIKPDEIRSVKKERKIDLEVIDLKRKLYSDTTGLIVLSNREIRLLRHIDLTEEVRRKIQQCKKVAKKLERLDMKAAQNNQSTLQSMNSIRNSIDEDNSLDAQTSGSSLGSSSNQNGENGDEIGNEYNNNSKDSERQKNSEALTEMGSSEIMDSSMFDELKDKMIESSNLLESLAGDDADEQFNTMSDSHNTKQLTSLPSISTSGGEHSEHEFGTSHDSCRCNCHKSSSEDGNEKTNSLIFESHTSTTPPNTSISSSTKLVKSKVENRESKVAVDMAIQCDLLS